MKRLLAKANAAVDATRQLIDFDARDTDGNDSARELRNRRAALVQSEDATLAALADEYNKTAQTTRDRVAVVLGQNSWVFDGL